MVCIHCSAETHVTNSRPQKRINQVWRRRQCLGCGAIFSTHEIADYSAAVLVRDTKSGISPFSRDKLFMSLLASCKHRPTALTDAAGLADTVMAKLTPLITDGTVDTRSIVQITQVALNRFDKAASVHYAAFHKI